MKFLRPFDDADRALQAIEQLRNPALYPHNIPPRQWLRRMQWMRERRLPESEQINALERRIQLHIITKRLTT